MSLLLTGILCSVGLPAQAESPAVPDPMAMKLSASTSDAGIGIRVGGAHDHGLVAVIYGTEDRVAIPLPFGMVLEVQPLGVLAWGKSSEGSWEAEVTYDPRYSAGLKFRLQAFSLALDDADADAFGTLRGSRSVVIKLPKLDPAADATGPVQ